MGGGASGFLTTYPLFTLRIANRWAECVGGGGLQDFSPHILCSRRVQRITCALCEAYAPTRHTTCPHKRHTTCPHALKTARARSSRSPSDCRSFNPPSGNLGLRVSLESLTMGFSGCFYKLSLLRPRLANHIRLLRSDFVTRSSDLPTHTLGCAFFNISYHLRRTLRGAILPTC